ncbi:hypothetical protein Agub_g1314 [Astrephomene gubernaculifera]|uniref:Uncharacterized protein n=1 Tax=Astrephomene gubernaculifera TaxID=47775 RepID=A0AAD3HHB4_9CHLO|nr:hypothetical protein Agub_g1314 [Astrephomene gubernaculifera]
MGSCRTLLERGSRLYGLPHETGCFRAAPARSQVTTYPEGSSCKARALTRQQHLREQPIHPKVLYQEEQHLHAGQSRRMSPGVADVPCDGLQACMGSSGPSSVQPAAVLLPPSLDGFIRDCGLAPEPCSPQDPLSAQHSQHGQLHEHEQYRPQLARGSPHARTPTTRPAHSGAVTYSPQQEPPPLQHQQHPVSAAQNSSDLSGLTSTAQSANPPEQQGLPGRRSQGLQHHGQGKGQLRQHQHHQQRQQLRGQPTNRGSSPDQQQLRALSAHAPPAHGPQRGELLPSAGGEGEAGALPPYLDAAVRSAGEVSTSEASSSRGGSGAGGRAGLRGSRGHGAVWGRERGQGLSAVKVGPSVDQDRGLTPAVAESSTVGGGTASAATAAVGLVGASAAAVGAPGHLGAPSPGSDACNGSNGNCSNGSGSSSNSSRLDRQGDGYSNVSTTNSTGSHSFSCSSNVSSSSSGARQPHRAGTPRSRQRDSGDGDSDGGVTPPSPPPPPSASELPSPAIRVGRGGIRYRVSDGWRIPRSPSRQEHRLLKRKAWWRRAALRHRPPTLADMRLTTRVMRALHWREILELLVRHLQEHELGMKAQLAAAGAAHNAVALPPQSLSQSQPLQSQPLQSQPLQLQPPLGQQQQQRDSQQQQQLRRLPDAPVQVQSCPPQQPQPHLSATTAAAAGPQPHLPPHAAAFSPRTAPNAAAASIGSSISSSGPFLMQPPMQPMPLSMLPLTPKHVAAMLTRTARLVAATGLPSHPAEARQLYGMVSRLARWGGMMTKSPDMRMREVVSIFYALVRLRHPLLKPYFIGLMGAARSRFATWSAAAAARRAAGAASAAVPLAAAAASAAAGLTCGVNSSSSNSSTGSGGGNSAESVSGFGHGDGNLRSGSGGGSGQSVGKTSSSQWKGGAHAKKTRTLPYNAYDMSQLIWCIASCGINGLREDWAEDYGIALMRVVRDLTAQGASNILYGMAKLRSPPQPKVLTALCKRLVTLIMYDSCIAGDAATPLPQRTHVRQQPIGPPASHLSQHAECEDTAAAAEAAVAASTIAATADTSSRTTPTRHGHCRPEDVSMSLWALATLRLPVTNSSCKLLSAAERYGAVYMQDFSQQELSNLVWAFAKLQYRPGEVWIQRMYDTVLNLLHELQPQALATVLYSTAELGLRPDDEWLQAVLRRAEQRLRFFTPQALAMVVHALAAMDYRPQASWMSAFHACLEARGQLDIRVLDKVREAYRKLGFRPGYATANGRAPTNARGSGWYGYGAAAAARTLPQGRIAGSWGLRDGPMGQPGGLARTPERWDSERELERVGVGRRGGGGAEEPAALVRPSRFG